MATVIKKKLKYEHFFDRKSKRHLVNGIQSVLHCHHYIALYTQLAMDAEETELLKDCTRESIREVLDKYFAENPDISRMEEKIDIACEYYALLGLGKMKMHFLGDYSGEVELLSSHTDSGWVKKWGKYDKPVNYITAGFIEAMCEIVLDVPEKTFKAFEVQSIVMGHKTSVFKIVRR